MAQLFFHKYQGTGNDFILIDNRAFVFDKERTDIVAKLCDRRFGIGADGLMLLQDKKGYDFEMVYYNSDGQPGSMCGNGGRCIVQFAHSLGIVKEDVHFMAVDGEHHAIIQPGKVSLKMNNVRDIEVNPDFCFLNTGSPHYVTEVKDIAHYPVLEQGKNIRYNDRFKKEGTNVNFIELHDHHLFVRTYERGVENETYSCGTGVTAAALVAAIKGITGNDGRCLIKTLGGNLTVRFTKGSQNTFTDVWLEGPATFVFEGNVTI